MSRTGKTNSLYISTLQKIQQKKPLLPYEVDALLSYTFKGVTLNTMQFCFYKTAIVPAEYQKQFNNEILIRSSYNLEKIKEAIDKKGKLSAFDSLFLWNVFESRKKKLPLSYEEYLFYKKAKINSKASKRIFRIYIAINHSAPLRSENNHIESIAEVMKLKEYFLYMFKLILYPKTMIQRTFQLIITLLLLLECYYLYNYSYSLIYENPLLKLIKL